MPNQHTKKPKRPIIYPVGPSIAYVQLTKGKYALIDAEDGVELGAHSWSAAQGRKSGTFYARRGGVGNSTSMHRQLMGRPVGFEVDHRNGNGLDNRVLCGQLRLATRKENSFNQKKRTTNKSGFVGVSRHSRDNCWVAVIHVHGKSKYLGSFETKFEAAKTYQAAAKAVYQEFLRETM